MQQGKDGALKLPIRIMPLRSFAIFCVAISFFMLGGAIYSLSWLLPMLISWDIQRIKDEPTILLFPVFLILGLVGMTKRAFASLPMLLPNSPLSYVQIERDAVVVRSGFETRRAVWKDISSFGIEADKEGKTWYVKGFGRAPHDHADKKPILLALDVSYFSPIFGKRAERATSLADWLNALLGSVHNGVLSDSVAMPIEVHSTLRLLTLNSGDKLMSTATVRR